MIRRLASMYRASLLRLDRSRYVLIIGHMRSRSSLLSHILGSHPAIAGYAELQMSYQEPADLIRLKRRAKDITGKTARIYLDKLVSGWQTISDDVVSHPQARAIFLLRRPEPTLRSIRRLARYEDVDWYEDPVKSAGHYLARLDDILRLASAASSNGFLFLRSEDLVSHPADSLRRVQEMLSLDAPFQLQYEVRELTGVAGHGDPSERIRSGAIQQEPRLTDDEFQADPPSDLLRICETKYVEACRELELLSRQGPSGRRLKSNGPS